LAAPMFSRLWLTFACRASILNDFPADEARLYPLLR
jgi:hypothetical protein